MNGFDHLYLETHDFDAMLRFWTALGFTAKEQWGSAADGHQGALVRCGDAVVVFATVDRGASAQKPTLHFSVKSVDQLALALSGSRDVTIVQPPEDTHWNSRWLRVRDPEGNEYAIESRGG
jgi:uncharacterized glyoxalase superfamily protein PhnB